MFSRRVFEALACGTPVISTKSVGMEKMLGKIVKVARNKPETSEFIEKLLSNEEERQRLAHLGYRCVHQSHTYKHRLDSVLDKLEIVREGKDTQPLVSVISVTHRPKDLDNCLQNYQRQEYDNKELLLVLNGDAYKVEKVKEKVQKLPKTRIIECRDKCLGECLNYGIENSQGDYLVKCDADDLYGNNFIGDMILPFTYTNSAIVGKWSYYVFLEGSNQLLLRYPGNEHKFTSLVSGGTIMLKREVYEKVRFSAKNLSEDTTFLRDCIQKGLRVWSTDKYNFVQMRRKELDTHTWKIEEGEVLKKPHHLVSKGLNLEYVYI
jgi:cellulose synthase/poly-beta-1,6-N-acetylglucosamine synthase-like glycosyltransferase